MMGKLSDALRREQVQDAARENQRAVRELVSNVNDRNQPTRHGFQDAVAEMDRAASARRMQMAREIIQQNPGLLESNNRTNFLMSSIPDLGPSEAREVLKEFDSSISDSRW
jgi:hypothetical protein